MQSRAWVSRRRTSCCWGRARSARASLSAMRLLHRLGRPVWPFDPPCLRRGRSSWRFTRRPLREWRERGERSAIAIRWMVRWHISAAHRCPRVFRRHSLTMSATAAVTAAGLRAICRGAPLVVPGRFGGGSRNRRLDLRRCLGGKVCLDISMQDPVDLLGLPVRILHGFDYPRGKASAAMLAVDENPVAAKQHLGQVRIVFPKV